MNLYCGDCRDVLKTVPDNSIDSVVTDPPYELGFMGKKWDASGIAYDVDMWREVLRVLKPGGFLLSFGGTRTSHRMVCAIEDAGFEIRDSIDWVYGSGFPKSLDIGKAVDKANGTYIEGKLSPNTRSGVEGDENGYDHSKKITLPNPQSEQAKRWNGWGTALKPAHEPICVARKPLIGTVAENVLKCGTGGINIDGSRIGTDEQINNHSRSAESAVSKGRYGDSCEQETHQTAGQSLGRFPANFIHDGSNDVISQFPVTQSGNGELGSGTINCQNNGIYGSGKGGIITSCFADKGSAARFFKTCEFTEEDLPAFIYCAKASKSERDEGCDEMEMKQQDASRKEGNPGGDNPRNRGVHLRTNNHPTVKPVKLMQYLVKLVTPPLGTVLDPFMGSGTTGVACKKEGFNFVGIEMDADHFKICEARVNNAEPEPEIVSNQLELF